MDRSVNDTSGARDDAPTDDAFLGGALHILQPAAGYRAGLDAVMLAAAVTVEGARSARPRCRRRRRHGGAVPRVAHRLGRITLFEREPALAHLARENAQRNCLAERVSVIEGDIGLSADTAKALGLEPECFDHVIANPPFHDADGGTPSTNTLKACAHAMPDDGLEYWARFMARMVVPGGAVTVIHKAEALPRLLAAFDGRFGALQILPLRPRTSTPAHRVILAGRKGSRAPLRLLPGFVLHGDDEAFTPQAQAILREGAALR